jgi:hypothetical protein
MCLWLDHGINLKAALVPVGGEIASRFIANEPNVDSRIQHGQNDGAILGLDLQQSALLARSAVRR